MPIPFVYHPHYVSALPDGHRFPMDKFGMLRKMLIEENIASDENFFEPDLVSMEDLELVHHKQFIEDFMNNKLNERAMRRIGLPWSGHLTTRARIAVGGTILTAKLALKYHLACNLAGGTHHAFPDFGAGFCIFNDLAVTAKVMQQRNLAKNILIIDLDVHQGDGTAFVFQDDPDVYTFSMHCEKNFPSRKQTSTKDIGLPVGMRDDEYLSILEHALDDIFNEFEPDLVLFDAGVDPHENDRLGLLKLTYDGLFQCERLVIDQCYSRGFPVACIIGGGYGNDLEELTYRHSILHRVASVYYQQSIESNLTHANFT